MLYFRNLVILAKIEPVYGVDAVPTGAANAILASNVKLEPFAGDDRNRDNTQPYMGARGDIAVNTHVTLSFDVEIAGGGAADTPPAYGPLLRACGFAETINVGTDVQYDPVSTGFEAVTMYFNIDGVRHALLGSRGAVSLNFESGDIPKYSFKFLGLFVQPADVALPAQDTSAFQTPLPVSKVNTPTFTIDGLAAVASRFSVDGGQDVKGRFLVNAESIEIVDHPMTGRAVFEAVLIATKDFFTLARDKTQIIVQLQHGTAAGNIVVVDGPTVEIGRPTYDNRDGIAMLDVPLTFVPAAGDDELKITTK